MNKFFKNFFIFLLLTFLVYPNFAFALNYDAITMKAEAQFSSSQKAIYDALSKLDIGSSTFTTSLLLEDKKKVNKKILDYLVYNIPEAIDYGEKKTFFVVIGAPGDFGGEISSKNFSIFGIQCDFCKGTPGVDYQVTQGTTYSDGTNIINNPNKLQTIKLDITFDVAEYLKAQNGQFPPALDFNMGVWWGNENLENTDPEDFILLNFNFPIKLNSVNCIQKATQQLCSQNATICMWASKIASGQCISKTDEKVCNSLTNTECAQSTACTLDKSNNCTTKQSVDASNAIDALIKSEHPVPPGYKDNNGPLPDCAFAGSCRDVNDLVKLGLNAVKYVFSIVAGLAFVMFIYGGFTWIFSFGNSEKVKKGQQIFTYAVIGLVIVFSAYILVGFLLDALNVSETFRGI